MALSVHTLTQLAGNLSRQVPGAGVVAPGGVTRSALNSWKKVTTLVHDDSGRCLSGGPRSVGVPLGHLPVAQSLRPELAVKLQNCRSQS
jgi:hypothetical protein